MQLGNLVLICFYNAERDWFYLYFLFISVIFLLVFFFFFDF